MSKHVDQFFESEKSERVKRRKVLRAQIKKVHEVLYKYSHEKMEQFVKIPELAFIFLSIKEEGDEDEDHLEALQSLKNKCKATLE